MGDKITKEKEWMEHIKQNGWRTLSDPLLVMIFKNLEVKDVVSCSNVCINWNSISQDNLLWKYLFRRDYGKQKRKRYKRRNVEFIMKPDAASWKEEYIRLKEGFPCVPQQTLKGHTDEVLHVAFSHDGSEIASCSKDHQMIVWRKDINGNFKYHFIVDMLRYDWRHTWAAQYSPLDTKLMVAGVVNAMGGEIAIFSTGDYTLLCRLLNDPYDVMGCWCSDNYFISGTMELDFHSFDASIWLCSPPIIKNKKDTQNGDKNLEKSCSSKEELNMDCDASINLALSSEQTHAICQTQATYSSTDSDQTSTIPNDHVVVSWYKKQLLKFRNIQGTIYVRYVQNHSRKHFNPDPVSWENPQETKLEHLVDYDEADPMMRLDLLEGHGDNISVEIETGSEGMSDVDQKHFADQEMCIVFICGDKTSVPHQVGFHRITSNGLKSTPNLTEPEKVLEMDGHVIGMTVSPDNDFLYVNVRGWPDKAIPTHDQAPPINENIELKIINLKTLEIEPEVLSGHKGFTPTEKAFYLYLDVSKDFVGSGSEDCNGYIWEKHYGVPLTKLNHKECVNCVVFNPKDQETCITASDDYTLQVWTSKRKERLKNKS